MNTTLQDVLARLDDVRPAGDGFLARCPAHDDRQASLSVTERGGRILLHCHAGCPFEKVRDALGLRNGDLRTNHHPGPPSGRRIVATYDYRDEAGNLLFQVVRFQPKDFRQRRPDGQGGWTWKLGNARRVLYRLPELLAADPERIVHIVEGEKAADRLGREGLMATCSPGGAGKWRGVYAETLRGRRVVVLPDNDAPGRSHAEAVARSLHGVAASVKALALPGLPVKGDVYDWFEAGQTAAELERLAHEAPEWQTAQSVAETLSALAPWVHGRLSSGGGRSINWEVAETVAAWCLKHRRLLVDVTQDAAQGGRPYLVADDGALWPLERDAVPTRLALYSAALNRTEHLYNFVLEALVMAAIQDGRRAALARWQTHVGDTTYVSCGPTGVVRAQHGGLERLPNGTDDVWFAGDACYPPWTPAEPIDPFSLAAFRPALEAPAEALDYTPEVQQHLLGAWLAGLLSGLRPLPVLAPLGQRGGGKSTLTRAVLIMLLGPTAGLTRLTDDYRDFASLATARPVICYDNVDGEVPPWFPDALSGAVTGIADQRRQLYTDGQVIERPVTAAFAVTTRTAAFMRPDVAERTVPLLTAVFEDANRQSDEALAVEVAAHRDGLLSWAALTGQALLARRHEAPPALPLRFVDFARLLWAYLYIQGRPEAAAGMLLALRRAQAITISEADPLTVAILGCFDAIADRGYWQGPASDLVRALQGAGAELPYLGGGKRIARMLREAMPTLSVTGLAIRESCDAHGHTIFTIRRAVEASDFAESAEKAESTKPLRSSHININTLRPTFPDSANSADSAKSTTPGAAKSDPQDAADGHGSTDGAEPLADDGDHGVTMRPWADGPKRVVLSRARVEELMACGLSWEDAVRAAAEAEEATCGTDPP